MLSPELHGCCLHERVGGAKCHWDPTKFGTGGRKRDKNIPNKRKFKLFRWRKNAKRLLPPLRSWLRGFGAEG